jgi:hypothetical protein
LTASPRHCGVSRGGHWHQHVAQRRQGRSTSDFFGIDRTHAFRPPVLRVDHRRDVHRELPGRKVTMKIARRVRRIFAPQCPCNATRLPGKGPDRAAVVLRLPAEHWVHLRTSNPLESTFATVRVPTYRTKGPGSRKAALGMAFKLTLKAEGSWRKLNGAKKLQELIDGTVFVDGIQKAA